MARGEAGFKEYGKGSEGRGGGRMRVWGVVQERIRGEWACFGALFAGLKSRWTMHGLLSSGAWR